MEESNVTTVNKQMTLSPNGFKRWVDEILATKGCDPDSPINGAFIRALKENDPIVYYLRLYRSCTDIYVGSAIFFGRIPRAKGIIGTPGNRIREWDAYLRFAINKGLSQKECLDAFAPDHGNSLVIGEFR